MPYEIPLVEGAPGRVFPDAGELPGRMKQRLESEENLEE